MKGSAGQDALASMIRQDEAGVRAVIEASFGQSRPRSDSVAAQRRTFEAALGILLALGLGFGVIVYIERLAIETVCGVSAIGCSSWFVMEPWSRGLILITGALLVMWSLLSSGGRSRK